MMGDLIAFLRELLPLWALLIVVGFGYLVLLAKRVTDRFLDAASKQTEYLKDRVDVVDKSTGVFTRTIDQQEKEISRLTEQVTRLSVDLQVGRETDARLSVHELQVLGTSIRELSRGQAELYELLQEHGSGPGYDPERQEIAKIFRDEFPRALRARDLSVFPIRVLDLNGSNALLRDLRNAGYAASLYQAETEIDTPDSSAAIWLGSVVPPVNAIEVIRIARSRWPFLRYVHLSGDSRHMPEEGHNEVFLGGATDSATDMYGCKPWTDNDFAQLRIDMAASEFHDFIRRFYRISQP